MGGLEYPIRFSCGTDSLIGMFHPADEASETGVLIVVGGPQYRIGSHRHFVELARDLASRGIPVMRFDVRGMGDSGGDFPGFEALDDDIQAAVDTFCREQPHVKKVVLWGLCDGASASILYAHRDRRIGGLVLLNPWIRSDASYAKTELKHYYAAKIFDGAFWRRLITGKVDLADALRSFVQRLRALFASSPSSETNAEDPAIIDPSAPLPDRMAQGINAYSGPILLIISGNDLTAKEFDEVTRQSADWKPVLNSDRIARRDLPESDHTFSRAEWSQAVNGWTLDWVRDHAA